MSSFETYIAGVISGLVPALIYGNWIKKKAEAEFEIIKAYMHAEYAKVSQKLVAAEKDVVGLVKKGKSKL